LKIGHISIEDILNEVKNMFHTMFQLKQLIFVIDLDDNVRDLIKTDF